MAYCQYGQEKVGILQRNEMGMLVWEEDDLTTELLNIGSRLKTPVLPIWVTRISDNWGVLFNPNRDLMKSYSAENRFGSQVEMGDNFYISRFTLFYYSNADAKGKGKTEIKIDTMGGEVKKLVVNDEFNMEELEQDDLKLAIQTK